MKKLLLLCFTILTAVGFLHAETKTVTIIPSPADGGTQYQYWLYNPTGEYSGSGTDAPYSDNFINVGQIKAEDIYIKFNYPETTKTYTKVYPTNFQMLVGFSFEIFGDPDLVTIKKVTFVPSSIYAKGVSNLVCDNHTAVTDVDKSRYVIPDDYRVNLRIKTREEGAVNGYSGATATSDGTILCYFTKITVEYEVKEPLPTPTLTFNSDLIPDNGSTDYEGIAVMRFNTGNNSELNGSTVYYKFVPAGETLTEFPVGDEAEAAGIKSVPISTISGLNTVETTESGTLYYWAYNATENCKSIPASAAITRLNRLTIYDRDGNVDGTLDVYYENEGTIVKERFETGKLYKNVKRLVFIPNAPYNKDAIIITMDGPVNLTPVWAYIYADSRFTITTQNGGVINKERFEFTRAYNDLTTKPTSCYIVYDDQYENLSSYWKIIGKTKEYNNPKKSHTFKASQGTGFDKLSIVWNPSDNVKAPSAPGMVLAEGGQGAFEGGIFRMIDQLDLKVQSGGPAYYFFATDNTTTDVGFAFGNEQYMKNDGDIITITRQMFENNRVKNARVLLQSGVFTDNTTKSNTAQAFIELIDAQPFNSLADIIKPENTGKDIVVTNTCWLLINGVYQTRVDDGSTISTWYAYVTDPDGNAIKIISQGTKLPNDYERGARILAGGLVGTFRYNYGSPEIVIGDAHRSFLKNTSYAGQAAILAPEEVLTLNTTPTTEKPVTDFNRKVRLRNVRWLNSGNEVEDKDGERVLIYSRLVACDNPADFTGVMFNSAAGTHWCIEGYVGQVNGKTAIFPTAKVLPCPTKPVLLAPNPVEGDIEAISQTVTVTVAPEEGMSHFYCLNEKQTDMTALTAVPEEGIVLTDEHFRDRGVCELYVYAKSAEGLWSTEPAELRITKHNAIEVENIAEFKRVFIDDTTGAEKKELFEADGSLKADAVSEADGIATHYQLTGNAIVVKRTPNYLYLRDYMDGVTAGQDGGVLGSMNYLLVYNANAWEQPKVQDPDAEGGERELRAGDVITGIALVPELTSLGNLRSNSSTFARTVTVNYDIASDSTKVQPLPVAVGYDDPSHDHYFSKVEVDDKYRMRYYTFEGVKVKHDDATDTYTFDMGTPVRMSFDIFSTRGGWVPAYDPDTRYTITGIVLRDGAEGQFALAPISFRGSGTVAAPSVFLTEYENNDVLASADIQEGGHTLKVKMTAEPGAVIYYSVNGKNPLHNTDAESRKEYTAGEEITLEFAEGQDRVVVMAFAAEPGKTPSAVVTRTFIKSSREMTYLLNFINQGEQDRLYHFNGHVAVAALGGKWMMVRGAVGHYLPIYNADAQWDADAYKTGGYLTDFVMRYDRLEGNIRGIAEAGRIFPAGTTEKDAAWEPITFTPDSVTSISERNARRYVKLHSANVQAAAATVADGDSDADAAKWTVTGTSHQGAPHALVLDFLGTTAGAATLEDGGMYDITGFVMLDADGAAQLWATEVEKIAQTARVSVKIDGTELTPVKDADTREYEAEFVRGALVTLEVNDPRPSTVIRYSYDGMNWFTYGEPFLVTQSTEQIHAVAQALNERESVHTHIKLTRKDETAAPVISAVEGTESSTVTISAEEGSIIRWWTSEDATVKTYTAPFVVESTMLVYATAQVEGKIESSAAYKLVKVTPAEAPEIPEDIEAKGNSLRFSQTITEEGWAIVTIEPVTPVEGGTIYYTTEVGKKLPSEGIKYEKPVLMKESGVIIAIMTIEGKPASQAYETTIWVVPVTTGIDGISGEGENAVRVDGSDIIAPEGSEVYDLNGRRVSPTGLAAGVYIVRTPDGKAVKVRI